MQTYEMVSILEISAGNMSGKTWTIDRPAVLNVREICSAISLLKFCFLQVDKHIRRLDTDLARFEADLKEKQIESTDYDSTSSKGKKGVSHLYLLNIFFYFLLRGLPGQSKPNLVEHCVIPGDTRQKEKKTAKTRSKVKSSDEDGSPKSAQKKVKLLQPYVVYLLSSLCLLFMFEVNKKLVSLATPFPIIRGEFNSPSANFGNVHPSDVLDMPVDPNEPTYCLCHQVSYGEMIGCDNTDVSFVSWSPFSLSQGSHEVPLGL